MKTRFHRVLVSGLMVLACLPAGKALGAGFQLYTEASAEALALGGAMSARRDMVSNAWYNPASLAGYEKTSLMLGATWADITYNYDTEIGNLRDTLEKEIHTIPHVHFVTPLSEELNLTVSLTAPYGLGTSWDDDFVQELLNSQLQGNYPGRGFVEQIYLETFYLTPSLAYAVNEKLSVAAGLSLVYAHFYMRPAFWALPGVMAVRPEFQAEGFGVSGVLAVNYKPSEDWMFGLKYQSEAKVDLTGDVNGHPRVPNNDNDIEGTATMPPTITLGIANRSIDRWTFGLDVIWTGWSTYDELRIERDKAGVNQIIDSEKDWNDVFQYRIGAEYELSEAWRLRCGYVFDESPIEEDTRGMELPGNDRHMLCAGFGYIAENWALDVGYSYLMVDASDAGTIPLADQGEFTNGHVHLLSCSLTLNF